MHGNIDSLMLAYEHHDQYGDCSKHKLCMSVNDQSNQWYLTVTGLLHNTKQLDKQHIVISLITIYTC